MPEGLVRTDVNNGGVTYKDGTPVTLPLANGTPVTVPHDFGIDIPVSDPTLNSNPVTWSPAASHFGNAVGPQTPQTPPVALIGKAFAFTNANDPDVQVTIPYNSVGGNSLFIQACAANDDGEAGAVTDITDSFGNTWVRLTSLQSLTIDYMEVWEAPNAEAITSVTVTFTGANSGVPEYTVGLSEYSNVLLVNTPISDTESTGSEDVSFTYKLNAQGNALVSNIITAAPSVAPTIITGTLVNANKTSQMGESSAYNNATADHQNVTVAVNSHSLASQWGASYFELIAVGTTQPPIILGLAPGDAPTDTPTDQTVVGSGFVDGCTVTCYESGNPSNFFAMTNVVLVNSQNISCKTPVVDPGDSGLGFDVIVVNPDGSTSVPALNAFFFD